MCVFKSAGVACAVLWGSFVHLLPGVGWCVCAELNHLGWWTVGRESRVGGRVRMLVGWVPE